MAREVAEALRQRGVELEFVTRRPRGPVPAEGNIRTTYYSEPGLMLPFEIRKAFQDRVRSFDPHVVHVHQPLPAFFAIPKTFATPVVYSFYSPWAEELKIKAARWPAWKLRPSVAAYRCIERRAVRKATSIVVLSETSREEVRHFHGRQSIKIPGGVNTSQFKPLAARKNTDGVRLITVRNLVPRMGLQELIRAMARVPENVRLDIGGDGPLRNELQELVKSLRLGNRVTICGRIPDDRLPGFYASAQWFILPTAALEGFGLVILESLASGTPVLGTRVGAIPELLERFNPGWLIDAPTSDSIAAAICRAIQQPLPDPDELHRAVASEFDWNVIAARYLDLYEELLATPKWQG